MARDLDTLLRDAVATTPVDTAAVLDRARTLRRRRAARSLASTLVVLGVVAAGVTAVLDDAPRPPMIAEDASVVRSFPLDLVPGVAVDEDGLVLRAVVDATDGRTPDELPLASSARAVPHAVGPDGTFVEPHDGALGTRASAATVWAPDGTATVVDERVVEAAVLVDGTALLLIGASSDDEDEAITAVLEVVDGSTERHELETPVPLGEDWFVVQDMASVAIATGTGAVDWRRAQLWSVDGGVDAEARPEAVAAEVLATWRTRDRVGAQDAAVTVGRDDGVVLDVLVEGAGSLMSAGGQSDVVDGRIADAWIVSPGGPDAVSLVTVMAGPGAANVAAVHRQPAAGAPAAEQLALPMPLLSVDGALWLRAESGVVRVAEPGVLAAGGGEVPRGPLATLPASPARGAVTAGGVAAAPAGQRLAFPSGTHRGRTVTLLDVEAGCCAASFAVAPDGALLRQPAGAARRSAEVIEADGTTVALEGFHRTWTSEPAGGPLVAFDGDGNLWALVDRWWSFASFPDLVVRRPGETSFRSVGHVPVEDLLGVDARSVQLHVQDGEVALVGYVPQRTGHLHLEQRVVIARAGQALDAAARTASLGRLAGVSERIESGLLGPPVRLGPLGGAELPDGGAVGISGPFLGRTGQVVMIVGLEPYRGARPELALHGGVVSAGLYGDAPIFTDAIVVGDATGATAVVRLPQYDLVQPLVAPDGALFAVVADADGERLVQLLTSEWRPAA